MELEELWKARKGDERKGLLAEIVQAETTVSLDWISGQLQMGTRSGCWRAIGLARERLKKDRKARKYRRDILKNQHEMTDHSTPFARNNYWIMI